MLLDAITSEQMGWWLVFEFCCLRSRLATGRKDQLVHWRELVGLKCLQTGT